MGTTLTWRPRRVALILSMTAGCLVLASLAGTVAKHAFGHYVFGLVPLFDLDGEGNIPTLFSTGILLMSALFLSVIAAARKRQGERDVGYWAGLAALFLFMSVDEFTQIHERFSEPIHHALNTSGALLFAWVIPYGVLTLLLMLGYSRFVLRLPRRTRRLTVLAGMVYMAGALGCEMIGGYWFSLRQNRPDATLALIATCEESLEMAGIVLFIYTLMSYIDSELHGLSVRVCSSPDE